MNAVMTPPWQPIVQSEDDMKRLFAQHLWERPDNPVERMNAAKKLFPRQDQVGLAMQIASEWPSDPVVVAELDRLGRSGDDSALPTKADIAQRYIQIADDKTMHIGDRMKALASFTALMGMDPKTSGNGFGIINNNINAGRVFVLPPAAASLEEWERGASGQQAKLIDGTATRKE